MTSVYRYQRRARDQDLNSRDRDVDKFGRDKIETLDTRDKTLVGIETLSRPRHLVLNYNRSLVVYHLLLSLCRVLKGLVYAVILGQSYVTDY